MEITDYVEKHRIGKKVTKEIHEREILINILVDLCIFSIKSGKNWRKEFEQSIFCLVIN